MTQTLDKLPDGTEIQVRYQCSTCNGTGRTMDEMWELFHREYKNWSQTQPDDAQEIVYKWWAERGVSADAIPQEQHVCRDCRGEGYQTEWVRLSHLQTS